MSKLKDVTMGVLSGIAVALGTVVFFAIYLFMHRQEKEDARDFVENAPDYHREEVLKGLGAKRESHEETIEALTHEVEKQTKEEVINGFKKAFGVRPVVDVPNRSDSSSDRSN